MTAIRNDPLPGYRFRVELDLLRVAVAGLQVVARCSECSGLEVETKTVDYQEGGLNEYIHRFRGQTSSPPLVLKRGLSLSDDLWRWHQHTVNGRVNRKSGAIYLLDAAGYEQLRWDFVDAYPVKWGGSAFNAATAGLAFESVELVHRGLSLTVLG